MTLLASIQVFGEVYTLADAIGFDLGVVHELYSMFKWSRNNALVLTVYKS
jgi:hypothetical protein